MQSVRITTPSRQMTATDAGFLYLERPHAPLHIGCLALIEGSISREEALRHVESRLPRLQRYSQRAVPAPLALGHPCWEDDPALDLRNHIFHWSARAPGGPRELLELVETLLAMPLDRTRPLWEMHFVEGLAGGRSVLFHKVHHCMIDGVSGAGLLEALLDARPTPPAAVSVPVWNRVARGDAHGTAARAGLAVADSLQRQASRIGDGLSLLRHPQRALASARAAASWGLRAATTPRTSLPWNAPIGRQRRLAFTRLPMEGVRRVRQVRGGTVNDVVVCALAGGLRRYLCAQGIPIPRGPVVALTPVSLRTPAQAATLGNRISAMLVRLPIEAQEESARLDATRAITGELKASGGAMGVGALLDAVDLLPPAVVAAMGAQVRSLPVANLIATNVPGPREPRYLGAHPVQALFPIVPLFDGLGLGLAVFSYAGSLCVGLNADPDLVPDLEKLRLGIEDAFCALLADADGHPSRLTPQRSDRRAGRLRTAEPPSSAGGPVTGW